MSTVTGQHPVTGQHHVEEVMGMMVSIDIRDDVNPRAVEHVVSWLHLVDATFSPYKEHSPITRLGRGEIDLDEAGPQVREVLELCEEMRERTNGAFDVFEVPAPNGTTLDPSGLVKGWSIERAAEILEEHGATNFAINAGGDIALRGHTSPGQPWRVGLRHPSDPESLAAVVEGSVRLGIATSATYERGAHIVDPRTGERTTGLASATVVGPDLTFADTFATAVFVMGVDEGMAWIDTQLGYDAFLITHDDLTVWSPGFARYRRAGEAE